ncbi:MAG: ferrochelatase [Dongiaceae bacterium]
MKAAIVLFNLGGPDRPDAVEPFLRNLFSDPAILRVPNFLRPFLARLIARRRAPTARKIYDALGGGSPILANTQAQARALEAALETGLDSGSGETVRCFLAMRYWHPFGDETARDIAAWKPDRIVLLPLYPQFSTTTTASSFDDWHRAAAAAGLVAPTHTVCCYPADPGFIDAIVDLAAEPIRRARAKGRLRLLFSAHGLPLKIVKAGDPYPDQVGETARAIAAGLGIGVGVGDDRDEEQYEICFQSRVGPVEWLGPYTDETIAREAAAGHAIVLVPLAFVSEHSETLVELDIEYRHLAEARGAAAYERVATVGVHDRFIAGLAGLVRQALAAKAGTVVNDIGARRCKAGCACAMEKAQ